MGTQQQPVIDQTMLKQQQQQQQQPQQQSQQQQSQHPHPSQQQQHHHHQQQNQHHQQQSQVPTHVGSQYTPHPEHYTYNLQYAPNAYPHPPYSYQPYAAYSMAAYPPVNANSVPQPQSSVPQPRASAPIQMSQPIYNSRPPHNQSLSNTSLSTRVKKPAILKDPKTLHVVPLPDQSSTTTSASKQSASTAASIATATDSTNSTPSTKSTTSSSSSKAPISLSSSSTPGDTPQELLKKIADVTTADNPEDVHDSSTPKEAPQELLKKIADVAKVENPKEVHDSSTPSDTTQKLLKEEGDVTTPDKPESVNESSTPGNEPQEVLKESADVKTADESENVNNDSSTTTVDSSDMSTGCANTIQAPSLKDGKRVYSIPFLYEVGTKLCNFSFKPQESLQDGATRFDPFTPSYNKSNNASIRQGDMGHRSGGGSSASNHNSRNSAGQENAKPRKIIQPTIISQEVELKQASNPWRPSKVVVEEDDLESLKKKFRSILNKLTPDNFDALANSVTDLKIDTEEKLGDVIDIVFAKALAEPGYCVLYGQMCSHLKKITAGQANFGNTLLKRCQAQFQADTYSGLNLREREEKIEAESDPDVKKQLCDELYEEKYRCRMRGLGLIKFIGELYKIEMLNDVIMMDCVVRLLQDTSEESIECLCDLLATIGEKLDKAQRQRHADAGGKQGHQSNQNKQSNQQKQHAANQQQQQQQQKASSGKSFADALQSTTATTLAANLQQQQQVQKTMNTLDQVFEELQRMRKNNKELTLRIKFKLLDTCELREKHNWRSKQTKDNNPKKLDEIREAHEKELEQERRQQQQQQNMGQRRGGPGQQGDIRRQLGHSGGSSNQLSSLDHHHNQQHHNNGSNHRGGAMHTSASSHSLRDGNNSMMNDMRNSNSNSALYAESFQKTKNNIKNLSVINPMKSTPSESLRPSQGLYSRLTPLSSSNNNSSSGNSTSNNK